MTKGWFGLIGKTGLSIVLLYAGAILFSVLLQFVPGDWGAGRLATPIGLGLSAWLMYAWFERKQGWTVVWKDHKWHGGFLAGGTAAAIIFAVCMLLLMGTGSVQIAQVDWSWLTILAQVFLFLTVAAGEEWLFRGYIFGLFQRAIGNRTAVLINSLLFTAIHLMNPGSMSRPIEHIMIEMTNIFLLAFLMSQARMITGTLWMAIGLHFLFNFFQSTVFGFVNGGKEVQSLLEVSYSQMTVWNGASYGLESSLILTPVLLLTIGVFGWVELYRNP
jgi:uncharacterized protein